MMGGGLDGTRYMPNLNLLMPSTRLCVHGCVDEGLVGYVGQCLMCTLNNNRGYEYYNEKQPIGWRCPNCGKGLAPHINECSCIGSLVEIDGQD